MKIRQVAKIGKIFTVSKLLSKFLEALVLSFLQNGFLQKGHVYGTLLNISAGFFAKNFHYWCLI